MFQAALSALSLFVPFLYEHVQWQLPLALATASKSASSGRGAAHCPGALAAILAEGGARKLEAGLRCSRQTEMKDQA